MFTCPAEDSATELATRFEHEVLPLLGRLYGAAIRLTGNRHDAEDLVQETMLRAYSGFHTFSPGTNSSAWLYRIMHNTWINQHRARQRRPAEVPIDRIAAREAVHAGDSLQSAELMALESVPDEDVRAALMALREQFRIAVYYADVAGLSYKEIATITGTAVGTVMSRLHRGRTQLRSSLREAACRRGLVIDQSDENLSRSTQQTGITIEPPV